MELFDNVCPGWLTSEHDTCKMLYMSKQTQTLFYSAIIRTEESLFKSKRKYSQSCLNYSWDWTRVRFKKHWFDEESPLTLDRSAKVFFWWFDLFNYSILKFDFSSDVTERL